MKKIIAILCIFVGVSGLYAQQESQFTQYMYNTMGINPGYTGTKDVISILGMYRAQWIGLEGAPKTALFSAHAPVSSRGDGIGFLIQSDQLGPSDETSAAASYAYALVISKNTTLSLGIRAGVAAIRVDYTKLNVADPDPLLQGVLSKFSPNIGAGGYLHSDKWYMGISVPNILETQFYDDIKGSVASKRMHFYFIGGYVFDLSRDIKFKPATLVKVVEGAPLALDLSANFLFNENFTVGVAYRLNASVSALAGFQITEGLHIGYAYDYDTSNLGRYNSGSHEIFLRFDITSSLRDRMVSPRFF